MKRLLVLIVFSVCFIKLQAQVSSWTYYEDTTGTLSSPKAADLNSDGILDIVIGAGQEDKNKVSTIAVNGANGKLLWKTTATNEIFGSAVFFDANKDKTPDVLMCGRKGILECRNGKNGDLIWEFFSKPKSEAADSGWHNFFQPQIIADQNNDGYEDILVSNGGDKSKSYTDTVGRPAGLIMVLSGKNGRIIGQIKTPDKQETYMAPLVYDFNNDGKLQVLFGSGGETMSGALWVIDLKDLIDGKPKQSTRIVFTGKKGFIAPPSIADLNLDGYKDIVVNAYNGDIMCFSGKDFAKLWQIDLEGFETQCSPAIGNFYGTHHPDVLAIVFKGQAPNFKDYHQLLIDGKSGKVVWQDSLSDLQFASAAAVDFNGNGYDQALFSYNRLVNNAFVHDLELYNFQSFASKSIVKGEKGINLSSTPLVVDLDGDDSLEICYSYKKNDQNPIAADGLYIKVLAGVAKLNPWGVAWNGYLGKNSKSVYENDTTLCSEFKLNVSVNKVQPSCNGFKDGEITLTLDAGFAPVAYTWSDNATGNQRKGLGAGEYIIYYMDQQGCNQLDTVRLKDPYEVEISADSTFCPGESSGAAYINSSGCYCANSGCKFKWNTGETDHSIYYLDPGTYTVELTHADGCKVYDTVQVFESHALLDTAIIKNVSCYGLNDGEITLKPFDSVDFRAKWFHTKDRIWHLDSLAPDTYTVELRDYRWCFDTVEFIVHEPDTLTFSVKDYHHINCYGDSSGSIELSAKGGWAPYTFFKDSVGYSDSVLSNLKAGNYYVQIKDSAKCGTDSQLVTLFQRPKLSLEFGSMPQTDPFNENGTAWVIATGGLEPYKYRWNHKSETNDTIFNLKANFYEVIVIDSLGCSEGGQVEVDFSTSVFAVEQSQVFSVFPNPTNGVLSVKTKVGAEITLTTYDGKELKRISTLNSITSIDCSHLPKGVYLLQCIQEDELQMVKVIVE
ncbi:MAG: T9SS type A sorting domain-containing protein [Bacteroidia bacterium]